MRYLVFWELNTEHMEKLIEKEIKYQELQKKYPDKYPKNVIPVHVIDKNKVFTVWDVDNHEQIANKLIYMMPEAKAKIIPVFEAGMFMKLYMKEKK